MDEAYGLIGSSNQQTSQAKKVAQGGCEATLAPLPYATQNFIDLTLSPVANNLATLGEG